MNFDTPSAYVSISPWVKAGDALTIVSFDPTAQAAALEETEERSLNLALRRRRIRSEVLRIALDADAATKAFLTDVIAALAGRRLLLLVRELRRYPEIGELVEQLCDLAQSARVIVIGEEEVIRQATHDSVLFHHIGDDDRAHIEMLANALVVA